MSEITLAVGQFKSAIGKTPANLSAVARLCAAAGERGAQLVLFPEDCLTGYPSAKGSATAVGLVGDGKEIQQLGGLARKFGLVIAVGFIERHGDLFHSSQAVVWPNGKKVIVRKRSVDARDETIGLAPSHAENPVMTVEGVAAEMCICMDGTAEFFEAAAKRGTRIVLHPSGGACVRSVREGDAQAKEVEEKERAGCRACVENARDVARRLKAAYCVANPVGFDGERGYPGNSFIIGPDGEVPAVMEGTAVVENMHEGVAYAKVML